MNFNYTLFLVIIFEKKCKCVSVMLENKCKCVSILKINYVGAAYIKGGKKGKYSTEPACRVIIGSSTRLLPGRRYCLWLPTLELLLCPRLHIPDHLADFDCN